MLSISVRNLKKNYPVIKGYRELILHPFRKKINVALDGIDLDVEEGKCFCLLGPNGAGKTTLIKILSTLVLPNEGKAYINGLDVEKEPEKVKSHIGYCLNEDRSFYWRLSGRQNLEFFACLNNLLPNDTRERIDYVLELTNLTKAADLRFNTYSTGMRQMMAFARALLMDAKILFVDEPTRSLDPQAAHKIREFLSCELAKKQGRTVFWVTHNLTEVSEFADELAIIRKGKIILKGNISEITENNKISLRHVYEEALKE